LNSRRTVPPGRQLWREKEPRSSRRKSQRRTVCHSRSCQGSVCHCERLPRAGGECRCGPKQRTAAAKQIADKLVSAASAPKGAIDSAAVAASLKRCPDTNRGFSAACKAGPVFSDLRHDWKSLWRNSSALLISHRATFIISHPAYSRSFHHERPQLARFSR
jgi:hypothetical protein